MARGKNDIQGHLERIRELGRRAADITVEEARELISRVTRVFRRETANAGYERRDITRVTTKFRDAGRRSAPWRPTSSRVPGRPQDGANGNRINRWLLPAEHKFYATELNGTLVEIKYYLQALSMEGAPESPATILENCFSWLVQHPVRPGAYLDPIQLVTVSFHELVTNRRSVQSGHLVPLDRGGRHEPRNAFLMLSRSNQLQGNLTLEELLRLMGEILERHGRGRALSGTGSP